LMIDPSGYPNTEKIYSGLISLPLYPSLSDDDVEVVVEALRSTLKEMK
jgi:dTDP-4-amino-4,6-dideoxygalactose transaminase